MTYKEYKIKWKNVEHVEDDPIYAIHRTKNDINHGAQALCFYPTSYDYQIVYFSLKGKFYGEFINYNKDGLQ